MAEVCRFAGSSLSRLPLVLIELITEYTLRSWQKYTMKKPAAGRLHVGASFCTFDSKRGHLWISWYDGHLDAWSVATGEFVLHAGNLGAHSAMYVVETDRIYLQARRASASSNPGQDCIVVLNPETAKVELSHTVHGYLERSSLMWDSVEHRLILFSSEGKVLAIAPSGQVNILACYARGVCGASSWSPGWSVLCATPVSGTVLVTGVNLASDSASAETKLPFRLWNPEPERTERLQDIAVCELHSRVYLLYVNGLLVYDASTRQLLSDFPLPYENSNHRCLAVDSAGGRVFVVAQHRVTSWESDSVICFSL